LALSDSSVYVPGTGFIYLAPASTAVPASLTSPAAPWVNLGHTSLDDGITITRDGGDSEVLGTWQNPSLRERKDPTTFALTMVAHQVDNTVLGLYFGGGDATGTGKFGVNATTGTTDKAMYVRIVDGANSLGPLPAQGVAFVGRRRRCRRGGFPVLPAARHGAAGDQPEPHRVDRRRPRRLILRARSPVVDQALHGPQRLVGPLFLSRVQ
jgi:hypothetical protein